MYGWTGTILRVDLSKQEITREPLGKELAAKYVGGRGLNLKFLYDELKPGIDPLGPDNKVIFGVGPCNGTLVPGNSRLTITAKSPLSGFIGDTNCAASLAAELKYAGYDMVIIEGKAESPVYLWIDDDSVELRDAGQLWGKTTSETRRALEREIGDPDIGVVSIGPAGENLVKFACVVPDVGRGCARPGIGAVMGSKKLKAVAVRGTKGVKVSNRKLLEEAVREVGEAWHGVYGEPMYKFYASLGTSGLTTGRPVRNYQQSIFEQRESISGQRMAQDYFLKPKSCLFCPFPCDHIYVVGKGPFRGTWGAGFQAGQLWWYGDNLGVSDPDIIVRASALSNEYGVDLMGMSGVIAFGMECFQRGVLTLADTGNLRLEWGNGEVVLKLIEMTVYRQGLGALFAEGIKKVSEQIGKGSEEYALHVKGLYPDEHDPRTRKGTGLIYAVAGRGAEHCGTLKKAEAPGPFGFDPTRGEVLGGQPLDPLTEDGKAQVVKWYEDVRAFENCMEICSFATRFYRNEVGLPGTLAKLYNAVTGFDLTEKDVMHIGERVINLGRAFNVREGLTRKDDTLPNRFLKEKMPDGPAKGQVVNLEPMLDEYYELRGWDKESGLPTKEKLVELNLEEVARELESMGKLAYQGHK